MLTKCNYLDKVHLCTFQNRWANSAMSWTDQLTDAILICMTGDIKLRNLFIRWSMLSADDRNSIDDNIITRERFDLYIPLMRAMMHWEFLQDTEGAPGFDNSLFAFTCDSHLEEELSNLVARVDNLIDRIYNRASPNIGRQTAETTMDLLDGTTPMQQLNLVQSPN